MNWSINKAFSKKKKGFNVVFSTRGHLKLLGTILNRNFFTSIYNIFVRCFKYVLALQLAILTANNLGHPNCMWFPVPCPSLVPFCSSEFYTASISSTVKGSIFGDLCRWHEAPLWRIVPIFVCYGQYVSVSISSVTVCLSLSLCSIFRLHSDFGVYQLICDPMLCQIMCFGHNCALFF